MWLFVFNSPVIQFVWLVVLGVIVSAPVPTQGEDPGCMEGQYWKDCPELPETCQETCLNCTNNTYMDLSFHGLRDCKTCGPGTYQDEPGQSACKLACPSTPSHIVIPNGTTEIAEQYKDCENITGVTFNTDGELKVIGTGAFGGAIGITNLTIPASVTNINSSAFKNCTNLEFVVLDASGGSSELEYIGDEVFDGCDKLSEVNVPGSSIPLTDASSVSRLMNSLCTTRIKYEAYYVEFLEEVFNETDGTYIGNKTGNETEYVKRNPCISGDGTRSVAILNVNYSCNPGKILPCCPSYPSHLTIPNGTDQIIGSPYLNCDTITGITFNSDGALLEISEQHPTFKYSDNFTNLTFPPSLEEIGPYSFQQCGKLEEVRFDTTQGSSQLKQIATGAFADNPELRVFEIPNGVNSFGDYVLHNCPQLERVIVYGDEPWNKFVTTLLTVDSINNIASSLCNQNHNMFPPNQTCIEGDGTRAAELLMYIASQPYLDNCNVTDCATGSLPAPPRAMARKLHSRIAPKSRRP